MYCIRTATTHSFRLLQPSMKPRLLTSYHHNEPHNNVSEQRNRRHWITSCRPIQQVMNLSMFVSSSLCAGEQHNIHTSCVNLRQHDEEQQDPNDIGQQEELAVEADDNNEVVDLGDMFHDEYLHPSRGHKVFIIQPDIPSRKSRKLSNEVAVSPHQQLGEACGLVQALPNWRIVSKEVIRMHQMDRSRVFTKGVYAAVRALVRDCRDKTAVFVNISMLTSRQLSTLQDEWGVPVYDRYTIILQIFHERAQTKEAKLQVALAKIPYYRSRLRGMHEGNLSHQRGGLNYMGGSGESKKDTLYRSMSDKEIALRKKLSDLKSQRKLLRDERKKKELPIVAVVGYTNAGKTSLIKVLTRDADMTPWDQVFATLDVTCHGGLLGNMLKVVYMDTVGFISDIPTSLIESFSATLEDTLNADVIVHVRDVSRADTELQKETVLHTLHSLNLPAELYNNIIEVNNKVDLIPSREQDELPGVGVSTVTGEGLPELLQLLEEAVMSSTGRVSKHLKIPQSGPHLTWLYREATVTNCQSCDEDAESLLVDVVMTTATYEKFCAKFQKKQKR